MMISVGSQKYTTRACKTTILENCIDSVDENKIRITTQNSFSLFDFNAVFYVKTIFNYRMDQTHEIWTLLAYSKSKFIVPHKTAKSRGKKISFCTL